jgi:D-lactate dehydrogenase (cytochrome)
MAVPDEYLSEILKIYRAKLDANNLQYVIFGHIGDNHVHVNILPTDMEEYLTGKKLYAEFAAEVLKMKGSVSAEHGIGKLKTNFLSMMLGENGINEMKKLKEALDPGSRLGKGTLFQDE